MAELLLLIGVLAVTVRPLGAYMALVYSGRRTVLTPICAPLEKALLWIAGPAAKEDMDWKTYAVHLMIFSALSFLLLYVMLVIQDKLPLNPMQLGGLNADLAFNITISFLTSTNWQSYAGEAALSNFSQIFGLMAQQFMAPATDMCVAVALFRGFARRQSHGVGNFWTDMIRGVVYILIPLSLLFSAFYAAEGTVQSWGEPITVETLEKAPQKIVLGPVAAQVAIKQLGTNGGGFYNANSAHPLENPTPLTNFLGLVAIILLPAAFVYTFGVMAGDRRQGWMIFIAMTLLATPLIATAIYEENRLAPYNTQDTLQVPGNMEGKEVRFGTTTSALWSILITTTANGATNSAMESMRPLTILSALIPMQLGGIVFGGLGAGILCMMMMVLVTVFVAGLMVGRTPEFMGKKLGPFEMKIAMLIFVIPAFSTLVGSALSVMLPEPSAALSPNGTQGYLESLYAFTSAANNNGSALAGMNANIPYYNALLAIAMFLGNCFIQVAGLAIAGSLARKNITPATSSTLPTHTALFIAMLLIILFISVLSYAPALVLGPGVDHLLMGVASNVP